MRRRSNSVSITPCPQAGEGLIVASDFFSGCHGHRGGGDDVSVRVSPGQEDVTENPRRTENLRGGGGGGGGTGGGGGGGKGMWQQVEADACDVEVWGGAGRVPGPRGEAVGVRSVAEEGQVTLTGST